MLNLISAGIEPNPGPERDSDDSVTELSILTINCNGLSSDIRLLQAIGKIKKYIKNSNCIIFLQETHNANITLLESIWTGTVHISIGTGGSRGVITLCTQNLKTTSFCADHNGRYVFTTVELGKEKIVNTANIYSPNNHDDSYRFIDNTLKDWNMYCESTLIAFPNVNTFSKIIAGDLNCVLRSQDAQNRTWCQKERRLADLINTRVEEMDMYDTTLRSQSGNNFTWNRGNTFSKIDHIFVSLEFLNAIMEYQTIWNFVKSDHAAISIKLKFNHAQQRGRSFPKLALGDLKSEGALELVRGEIIKAIETFPSNWTPHLKLDYVKLVIRTNVLEIRSKNRNSDNSIESLRRDLDYFSSLTSLDNDQAAEFNAIRSKLYKAEEVEAERLKLIAGIKWREQGERSNKFFLNMINTNKASSTVDYLNIPEGKIENIKDILTYSKEFYRTLYSKRKCENLSDFYQHCPTLSGPAQEDIRKSLTIDNLKQALKTCKDSTPGLDGIPYSYYKIFGKQLLPLILESWEYSNITGSLPQSQATSVISLIPKIGKDKHDIKNWRPISISSCDLKIITKAYSIKVGAYLGEIISESQMGYVPGRDINFNNRLLRASLDFCNSSNLDYVLMSLDAQKAYDSVDHEYINKTLSAYGFPNEFISAVNILHSNLSAQVQVNGFLSEAFPIQRGVKQGDALSCALFIIAIDPLIRNIENNSNISPLRLTNDCLIKTLAYADDIAIITPNDDRNIEQIFNEYMKLTLASGLTLNADKTEILNLSQSDKIISNSVYNNNPISIVHKKSITICGNLLCLDNNVCYQANITDKIGKLKTQLDRWKSRNLTINGKMIVLKTFAISQLIFTSQFQIIRRKDVRKIEQLCYSFVWNGIDRVKRGYLKAGKDEGGINGIDVESFFYTVAIRQFTKSNSYKKLESINNSVDIREEIKTHARHILRKILVNQLNNADIDDPSQRSWINQTQANLLVKTHSKTHALIDRLEITNISSINPARYRRGDYNQIRRALPAKVLLIIDSMIQPQLMNVTVSIVHNKKICDLSKLPSRILNDILKVILQKKIAYHPACKYPFEKELYSDIRCTWHNLWLLKNPTLRAIRLKVLYKDIWTQEKRLKLGISNNELCTVCGNIETVSHQLFLCTNAKRIWEIGRQIAGYEHAFEYNPKDLVNLIEVTNNIPLEIVKSVIFKFLIQIDRSQFTSEIEIKKSIGHWINIEVNLLKSRFKGNSLQLLQFNRMLDRLHT